MMLERWDVIRKFDVSCCEFSYRYVLTHIWVYYCITKSSQITNCQIIITYQIKKK